MGRKDHIICAECGAILSYWGEWAKHIGNEHWDPQQVTRKTIEKYRSWLTAPYHSYAFEMSTYDIDEPTYYAGMSKKVTQRLLDHARKSDGMHIYNKDLTAFIYTPYTIAKIIAISPAQSKEEAKIGERSLMLDIHAHYDTYRVMGGR